MTYKPIKEFKGSCTLSFTALFFVTKVLNAFHGMESPLLCGRSSSLSESFSTSLLCEDSHKSYKSLTYSSHFYTYSTWASLAKCINCFLFK